MKSYKNGRPARMPEEYTVLLLDADKHSRMLHAWYFKKLPVRLIAVRSPFGLLRHLLSRPTDLVILEIHMKGKNYYSLISAIKRLPAKIPVIVQSTQGLEENKQQCFARGCDVYFVKPLPWEAYRAKVMELLGESESV
ncbi:MAG: response regulator [Bacteroidales bacterium]|nr:response regulator [Bacteroidales bacterium]